MYQNSGSAGFPPALPASRCGRCYWAGAIRCRRSPIPASCSRHSERFALDIEAPVFGVWDGCVGERLLNCRSDSGEQSLTAAGGLKKSIRKWIRKVAVGRQSVLRTHKRRVRSITEIADDAASRGGRAGEKDSGAPAQDRPARQLVGEA